MKPTIRRVLVKCIKCRNEATVGPEQKDVPLCQDCGLPMLPVKASHSEGT